MILSHRRYDSDVWLCDREEECHLPRMIDPILENEIFWVRSETTDDRTEKYIEPEKWVSSSCFCSDNRERESEFSIVVIWRKHDIRTSVLVYEKFCYMRTDSGLPDRSCDSDNIGFLYLYDESSERAEEKEKNRLHKKILENSREKKWEIKKK